MRSRAIYRSSPSLRGTTASGVSLFFLVGRLVCLDQGVYQLSVGFVVVTIPAWACLKGLDISMPVRPDKDKPSVAFGHPLSGLCGAALHFVCLRCSPWLALIRFVWH